MAEPIGMASGLLALSLFAFQSSLSLYQLVSSFQSRHKKLRDLKDELQALSEILKSLQNAVKENSLGLQSLNLPLLQCGQVCTEFETVVRKCTSHSDRSNASFRDWAKLRYLGDDIDGYKNMLAGYKATINIAPGDANLRMATVTAGVLEEYKVLVVNTTSDLEEHLKDIEMKLQAFAERADNALEESDERERLELEKESTKQCLLICTQFYQQVDQVRPNIYEDDFVDNFGIRVDMGIPRRGASARHVTSEVLGEFKMKLARTSSELEAHMKKIDERLQALPPARTRAAEMIDRTRIQQERDTVRQCLEICTQAASDTSQVGINIFEDISAAADAHQIIVSTFELWSWLTQAEVTLVLLLPPSISQQISFQASACSHPRSRSPNGRGQS